MDGSAPSAPALPPLSQPAPPTYRAPAPLGSSPSPVGRPSNDPEQQQQRVERSAELRRIEGVLPKSIDSKVLVYRSRDGRILPSAKPILTVLVSDLEAAKRDDSTMDTEVFVAGRLADKNITEGRFVGRFVDKSNRVIANTQFEVLLGDEGSAVSDLNDIDEDDNDPRGGFIDQPMPQYQAPPPPPSMDPTSFTRAMREERNDEAKRGADLASLIAGQQQSTTQMMMQMQQQQREAADLARRDAADREERAEKRRTEFRQTLLTIIPLVLPLIQNFFKKDHGPDATQQMMMELFKAKVTEKPEKGVDAMMLETVMKTMGAMTTQQMAAMQQGTVLTAQMQGEATGLIFKNLMGSMKEMMDSKKDSEPKEKSTFQQILEVAGPVLAGLQQQQPAAAAPTNEQLAPATIHTPEVEPPRRRQKIPPPQATAAPPADTAPKHTDIQLIGGCLTTIANLSIGKILPVNRFSALEWIKNKAPVSLLEAVKSGSRERVLELGGPAVMANPHLLQWISDEANVKFLEDALADLKLLIDGTLTKEKAEDSIINQAAFTTKRKQAILAAQSQHGPPVAHVVPEEGATMTAHPAATEPVATTPPAAETTPPAADASPAGTPTADAPAKPRRTRKKMPPVEPQPGA